VLCGRRLRSCGDRLRSCDDVDVLHPWWLREKGADDFSPPGERRWASEALGVVAEIHPPHQEHGALRAAP